MSLIDSKCDMSLIDSKKYYKHGMDNFLNLALDYYKIAEKKNRT